MNKIIRFRGFLLVIFLLLTLTYSLGWGEEEKCYATATGTPAEHLILQRIEIVEGVLDKIYSMVADLHIKQMGIERYNQIYDPNNEGEVAKQKRLKSLCPTKP